MKRNEKLITTKYLEFFIPTVLTAMATNLSAIVDASLVGNFMDSAALSVINILLPVVQVYAALSIMFGVAGSSIIAGSRGGGSADTAAGNKTFTVICTFIAAISVVLMAVQLVFLDGIISMLAPVKELRPLLKEYYLPVIIATPVTLFMSSLVHIVRTDNRPGFATWIVLTANIINLVFDIIFIKFLGLGLTGASLATVMGSTAGLAMVISHFLSKKCTIRWDAGILKDSREYLHGCADVAASGFSSAIGTLLTTAKLLFLNTLIQVQGGKAGMAAFSAVSICQILESSFVTGGCQSMVPVVSLLYGEKDYTGIKMAFRKAVRILAAACIAITAVMEIFPQLPAIIYGIKGAEMALTIRAVRISALMLLGDALTYLFIYMYVCTGNRTLSSAISILNGIVLIIPAGLILSSLFGVDGVWIAQPAAQYAALAITAGAAMLLKKRKNAENIYLLDERYNTEVMAFSVGEEALSGDTAPAGDTGLTEDTIRTEITACADADTAAAVLDILNVIEQAETAPRRHKYTDVRVCAGSGISVLVKNSGALLTAGSFEELKNKYPSLTYSEAIGFAIITWGRS